MKTGTFPRLFSVLLIIAAAALGAGEAGAGTAPSVVEISPPPTTLGTNVIDLRTAADGEIRKMNAALLRDHRHVVVSVALTNAEPSVCNVNATVRDARTGAMLAIIETDARAEGGSLSQQQRPLLAYAAVRNAVRRVPDAVRNNSRR